MDTQKDEITGTPKALPVEPTVATEGIPGFHHEREEDDGIPLAHMQLDKDEKRRVNTGTGDQPGNTGGSRFATTSGEAK